MALPSAIDTEESVVGSGDEVSISADDLAGGLSQPSSIPMEEPKEPVDAPLE